ncbi:MAG: glycosyltransferase family A protein [Carnobacterium sp.]|uniref:glycosyltransferase family 2 protein n=1 Tax=Carnobacterium sp. TaxID=48221 RepID=UPI0028E493F2|nr:glycosyltransferase family A protein [Carnobacterium maltaromaticum]
MTLPLVTIFIPLYNGENYIKETLESAISQSYSNLDILVINDGSTDSGLNIVKSFSDPRIRIIENKKNSGIAYTRNRGLQEAKGLYIAFLDADDIALPNRIETQVSYMERNIDVVATSTYYTTFGSLVKKQIKPPTDFADIKLDLMFTNPIGNSTAMVRKKSITEFGIIYKPYIYGEDYDFWFQLTKIGKIVTLPEKLVRYRVGHESITKTTESSRHQERRTTLATIHEEVLNHYDFDLSPAELTLYNTFFDDNSNTTFNLKFIHDVKNLFSSLEQQNTKFNSEKFSNKLFYYSLGRISAQKLSLNTKEKLLRELFPSMNIANKIRTNCYLTMRSIYKLFSNLI